MKWFDKCAKVPWQPPSIAFQIVWPILYTLYAILIILEPSTELIIGLIMNLCWVPLFVLNTQAALILIIGMIVVGIKTIIVLNDGDTKNGRKGFSRRALIFLPYLLWICFAFTLNAYLAYKC